MKICSWNIRGGGSTRKREIVRSTIRKENPDIAVVLEIKKSAVDRRFVASLWKSRFVDWVCLPAEGRSGGILVLWDPRLVRVSDNLIGNFSASIKIQWNDDIFWWFTAIYGPCNSRNRELLWDELAGLNSICGENWCVGGDFNVVRNLSEKLNSTSYTTKLQNRVSGLDAREAEGDWTDQLNEQRREARCELEIMTIRKQQMVGQKAKVKWMKDGNQNSKFFYSILKNRRNRAFIEKIELEDGSLITDDAQIQNEIITFFERLYKKSEGDGSGIEGLDWMPLSRSEAAQLEVPFAEKEVKAAVMECDGTKAPGPDGFTLGFYQQNWETVKDDLIRVFDEFFQDGIVNAVTNETYICLIPKKNEARKVNDFRPISLTTSLYKILAKVLTNRLRKVMTITVSENQSAFIQGRQITDCCLIANEVVEEYRRKKKKRWVLKIDLEKAYDNVDWRFMDFVLRKKGFGVKWRKWMKGCVSNVSYSILINGRPRGKFRGGRGLRQGDPLSPFLFNLVIDGMGRLIDMARAANEVRGLVVGRDKMEVTHIQFADDTLFLIQSATDLLVVVELLKFFCTKSGLKINFEKSSLLGLNRLDDEVDALAAAIGCKKDQWPIKYLGLPLGGDPKKLEFWTPVISKMSTKLGAWKKAFLSRGARLVLIKSVLNAMPTYYMSIFKVPNKVEKQLEALMRNFLWDGADGETHNHVVNWNQVCKPRDRGGLGLENIRLRNRALLGKWWWRCATERNSLWKKVVGSIYGFHENGWDVRVARNATFKSPWKFISRSHSTCQTMIATVLKGGNIVRFWEDRWVGFSSFQDSFPHIYLLASNSNKPIAQFFSVSSSHGNSVISWDVRFRRDLNDIELGEYTDLLGVLESVSLSVGTGDVRVWLGDSSGVFSVNSFYTSFFPLDSYPVFPFYHNIWKVPIPQKVKVFSWIVALGKIQTTDNLQRRRPELVLNPQRCYLCKNDEETQDHILLHCAFTTNIWTKIMRHLGFEWTFPAKAGDMLISNNEFLTAKGLKDFCGTVPQSIGNLSKLLYLDIRRNYLYSENLDRASHVQSLEYLEFSDVLIDDEKNNCLRAISKLSSIKKLHWRFADLCSKLSKSKDKENSTEQERSNVSLKSCEEVSQAAREALRRLIGIC
ncbi:uncharacterized protein [Primulina eburnea]|uniref:uncharacterized protein n=1 Tax=Primulina eburnea TaxID=1245227 RepID=UPI003C6C0E01